MYSTATGSSPFFESSAQLFKKVTNRQGSFCGWTLQTHLRIEQHERRCDVEVWRLGIQGFQNRDPIPDQWAADQRRCLPNQAVFTWSLS